MSDKKSPVGQSEADLLEALEAEARVLFAIRGELNTQLEVLTVRTTLLKVPSLPYSYPNALRSVY